MSEDRTPSTVGTDDKEVSSSDNLLFAKIVYILYLTSFILGGITSIVGVVIAYIHDKDAPEWLNTHYRFQIRTFWISLCYGLVSVILIPVLIGIPLMLLTILWFIIRSIKGFKNLLHSRPIENIETWWL